MSSCLCEYASLIIRCPFVLLCLGCDQAPVSQRPRAGDECAYDAADDKQYGQVQQDPDNCNRETSYAACICTDDQARDEGQDQQDEGYGKDQPDNKSTDAQNQPHHDYITRIRSEDFPRALERADDVELLDNQGDLRE